jgi:hypothetical protein
MSSSGTTHTIGDETVKLGIKLGIKLPGITLRITLIPIATVFMISCHFVIHPPPFHLLTSK